MAHTTQVSFRIDEDIKKNAEIALEDMGLTMSAAITVFLKKVGRGRRIPFEIIVNVNINLTFTIIYLFLLPCTSDDYVISVQIG